MQGKKGCHWGFDTVNNKVAWVAALAFVVSGAALLATGIKTVNGCHEQYQTCRAANGPLSDLDTDKCVPVLAACAKPGIAQYTIGAILLAGVVLPVFYFCCCAIKPDKDVRLNPSAVVPEMDGVGKKTQSVDCEKQTSQQEYISSHHDGPMPEAYRYEYQTPSATTYVINPMKAGSARMSNASEASSANRNIALFPTRTMSVFGPEQEPSRNFSQVRVTDALEIPATYGVALQRQGSAVSSQKSRDGGQGSPRSPSARSIRPFHQDAPPQQEPSRGSQNSNSPPHDEYYSAHSSSPKSPRPPSSKNGSTSSPKNTSPKISPLVFNNVAPTPKRIPSFYDRL